MKTSAFLKKYKIKPTVLRVKLLRILKASKIPLSYDDLSSCLSANKTTIYRNLELFEQAGILVRSERDRRSYYELAKDSCGYFVCDVCHSVRSISIPILTNVSSIKSAVIKGVCTECE